MANTHQGSQPPSAAGGIFALTVKPGGGISPIGPIATNFRHSSIRDDTMDIGLQLDVLGHAEVVVVLSQVLKGRGSKAALDAEGTRQQQQAAYSQVKGLFSGAVTTRAKAIASDVRKLKQSGIAALTLKSEYAPNVLYLPNLGILVGSVDRKGNTALGRKIGKGLDAVIPLPELSLIRPAEGAALAGPPDGIGWGVSKLGAPKLWDQGITGSGVLIGHLDTGVDDVHPVLNGAVDAYAEFDLIGQQLAGAKARDSAWHGTHTAGLIAGRDAGGRRYGMAPEAKLACAMVIEGGKVAARVLAGMDWCVGQDIKILSMSLGLRGFDPQFQTIMGLVAQRGILPIIAIGNEGPQTSRSPGNYPEALSVGATDVQDNIWPDSSSQTLLQPVPPRVVPDVIAPGAEIWSSQPGGGYRSASGTSMAAPHVAGLAALLWQKKPEATAAEIREAILNSCVRPAAVVSARGNRGIPDATLALAQLNI